MADEKRQKAAEILSALTHGQFDKNACREFVDAMAEAVLEVAHEPQEPTFENPEQNPPVPLEEENLQEAPEPPEDPGNEPTAEHS